MQRGVLDEALVEGGGRRDKQKDTRAEGQEQWWCGRVFGPSPKNDIHQMKGGKAKVKNASSIDVCVRVSVSACSLCVCACAYMSVCTQKGWWKEKGPL